jgi:hypothetical protein
MAISGASGAVAVAASMDRVVHPASREKDYSLAAF